MKKISARRFSWPLFFNSPFDPIKTRIPNERCVTAKNTEEERNTVRVWDSERNTHAAIIHITITVFRCPQRQCHWRAKVLKTFFFHYLCLIFFFLLLQVFFSTVSVAVLIEVKKIYVIERDFKTGTSENGVFYLPNIPTSRCKVFF